MTINYRARFQLENIDNFLHARAFFIWEKKHKFKYFGNLNSVLLKAGDAQNNETLCLIFTCNIFNQRRKFSFDQTINSAQHDIFIVNLRTRVEENDEKLIRIIHFFQIEFMMKVVKSSPPAVDFKSTRFIASRFPFFIRTESTTQKINFMLEQNSHRMRKRN